MNKIFTCITTIIDLHTSPESLKIKKDQGLDAWIAYTIYLAYIRKYKGLDKSSTNYRYFLLDIKTATRMTDERLLAIENYLIESDILFIAGNDIQHSELYNYMDELGEVKRNAVKARWAKAEAMEPKEQKKHDLLPVDTNLFQSLKKIALNCNFSIREETLLNIIRKYKQDTIQYFINNLDKFTVAAKAMSNKAPYCLGEYKLLEYLKKSFESGIELKKELPSFVVNLPVANPTPSGNYNQTQQPINDPNLPDFRGKYRKIFTKKSPATYSWAEFVSVLIEVMDRPILKPTVESRWFMSLHSPEEWMVLFDKWFLVDNIANIAGSKQRRLKELVSVDKLRMVESENAIADRKANEVLSNG